MLGDLSDTQVGSRSARDAADQGQQLLMIALWKFDLALKSALQALKDPELLAEARRARINIDAVTGGEQQTLIQEVMNQPAEVIERAKQFLAN
jgi:hypothetical protein